VPRELATFSLSRFKARWNWLLAEMSVGDLASLPTLTREPAYADGRRRVSYGVETPTPSAGEAVIDR
jgi:hypothetical protein